MNQCRAFCLVAAVACGVNLWDVPARVAFADDAPIPAFPGAEGFGAMTPGGRGGRVISVSNLNDSGPGSLRQALEVEKGPRIVIFRVAGTIELTKNINIGEDNSYVTVAGQTAPGDGIQLKNFTISVAYGGHDVVIRYLRMRPGLGGLATTQGSQIDGCLLYGPGVHVHHVVIDHCSIQWALDENADVWGWVTDATFQWCIIAEGATTGHEKGTHSMGMLIGSSQSDKPMTVSVHHCLFAHNAGRNPLVQPVEPQIEAPAVVDFRNNVVYNWSGNNSAVVANGARVNFVNNLYLKGPSSGATDNIIWLLAPATLYVDGNWGPRCPTGSADGWAIGIHADTSYFGKPVGKRALTPFPTPPVTTHPTGELKDAVLGRVGACLPRRDAVDARIVQDVLSGTGKMGIGSDYPTLSSGTPPQDTDGDGMPDAWERDRGLDPADSRDGSQVAPSGYTRVEEYLNGLSQMPGQAPQKAGRGARE
ncbi:MAG: pectate lyase [bacterium]|nr:pectate lyase [bacterium]